MKKHFLCEKKNIPIFLFAAVLITACIFMTMTVKVSAAGEDDQNEERKEIAIEVVEDIPAGDIEDADIPLAAMPSSAHSNGVRHIGMMLLLLIAAVMYAAYFISYEKRLVLLRQQAAEAEVKAMHKRRKPMKRRETDER